MAQTIIIYDKCEQCHGDGIFQPGGQGSPSQPCSWPGCLDAPVGQFAVGSFELEPELPDMDDKLNDIIDALADIKELIENP